MSKSIQKYYKYHYREQLDFRYRLYLLSQEKDLNRRVQIAQNLIYKACVCGMGILSCYELETPFLDLAEKISTPNSIDYQHNSYLHVMTQAYLTGGHTRVVERWIDTSPLNQKHSIVLLDQKDISYPDKLKSAVSSHSGGLYIISEDQLLEKALTLRKLALEYEYVVLHVHMYDATPIVAFGVKDFKRPVILFNHAEHSYWCGSSIVDMLADLSDNDIAVLRRGINNVFTLRIPFEPNPLLQNYPRSKEESRKKIGLPLDKIIILTVGGEHKYEPFAGCEFCDIMSQVIMKYDNVVCYGIGPNSKTGNWSKYGDKFKAVGRIDYNNDYFDYLNACDIYINSVPIGGGTAIIDAVQFHKPILSYSLFDTKLGDPVMGIRTTHDITEFYAQLEDLLNSKDIANNLSKEQYDMVLEYHGIKVWRKNLELMIKRLPKEHTINRSNMRMYKIDDLAIMTSLWNRTLSKREINIYDVYHIIKMLSHDMFSCLCQKCEYK